MTSESDMGEGQAPQQIKRGVPLYILSGNHYVAGVSIFLLALVLIAGTVGCGGPAPAKYDLTMAVAPADSGTATDLTGASPYTAGTAVSIKAVANQGYQFVGWTATAGTFADASAAETTFTMPAQDATVTANHAEGTLIRTWIDLNTIRNNLGGKYLLMNNLDSSTAGYTELASPIANGGQGWQPIGRYTIGNFTGTFDGQGYEIKDFFVNRPTEDVVGLFGDVGARGTIKHVGLVNASVTGTNAVGGLAGYSHGTVSNSYSTGSVTGNYYVGGLVGISGTDGSVSYSYSTSSVTGNDCGIGGLIGYIYGSVSYSYSTGSVTGRDYVGGLVGYVSGGTVSWSYATGGVTGDHCVGGLVGFHGRGSVSNSYSTGSVTGNNLVGGLVGRVSDATVGYSYSTGSVRSIGLAGGLVGENLASTVSNSFWDTETSGQGGSAGGIGKTTAEMKSIDTFQVVGWSITYVADPTKRNTGAYWNIVDDQTYPFLSWQPI